MKKKKKRKLKFKRVLLAIFVLLVLTLIGYIISLLRVRTYYVYNNTGYNKKANVLSQHTDQIKHSITVIILFKPLAKNADFKYT